MKIKKFLISIFFLIALFLVSLPQILNMAGLHPDYQGEIYEFENKKALIVATNHGVLNKPGETDGKPTGLFYLNYQYPTMISKNLI